MKTEAPLKTPKPKRTPRPTEEVTELPIQTQPVQETEIPVWKPTVTVSEEALSAIDFVEAYKLVIDQYTLGNRYRFIQDNENELNFLNKTEKEEVLQYLRSKSSEDSIILYTEDQELEDMGLVKYYDSYPYFVFPKSGCFMYIYITEITEEGIEVCMGWNDSFCALSGVHDIYHLQWQDGNWVIVQQEAVF